MVSHGTFLVTFWTKPCYVQREEGSKNGDDDDAGAVGVSGDMSGVLHCHLLSNEAAQALQILAVQLNVIVSRSLHPERLHSLGAALEQSQAVGEVDHLVLCPMDDEHGGRDFGYFLDARRKSESKKKRIKYKELIHLVPNPYKIYKRGCFFQMRKAKSQLGYE